MISLYTTAVCPKCKILAAWLKEHDIVYQEKRLVEDLLQDGEVMADLHMQGISFRAAPVLQVGASYYGPEKLSPCGELDEAALRAIIGGA